ncbi:lytic polysaccharide monooxygenase [Phytohabitans sp. ZYX-F-186]|uniref:Lytic polysaccharide monooxygenase n=1 Tax=Phytohabitans maris TaxID=3071409 RepID=A0ABU0ZT42_9ACTN|nr:lytic polysaccharide monooxygenase [Phytohabitans sp. ZYX-F-186]MDQ7909474.1 lytic polysaccharide monooxygenase [Phytohabitans sp. ZYX-F-186]
MRKVLVYPLVIAGTAAAGLVATGTAASAHGYVSAPPSRQALCASRAVADCGQIQFEPQSVEGPKGLRSCDGGLSQFAVLNDESRNWPARAVGSSVTFTWVFTARHRTANWEYFVGGTRVAVVDGGNQQPDAVVSHQVDLSRFPGRRTVLAIWNIGDTANAFYSCIDLNVGGGGTPQDPPPATTAPPSTAPTTRPPATTPPPAGNAGGTWATGTSYKIGDEVTFQGKRYRCRQAHTSLSGWEPSIFTLALWLPV